MGFIRTPVVAHPGFVAGNWYQSIPGIDVAAEAAAGTGTIRLLPFYLPKAVRVTDLGMRITTTSAGGNCSAAIYAHNAATARPTGNALVSTGNMSTASAANVSAAVGAAATLPAGWYWAAHNQDNATVAFQGPGNNTKVHAAHYIGSTTLATISSGAAVAAFCLSVTQAYGSWPDLTGATFTETSGVGNCGNIYFKAG